MHRLALVALTALTLTVAPPAHAGESCAQRAAEAAAAADPAAEAQADEGTCMKDGACCGAPECAAVPGDQASAGKTGNCPCKQAREKQL
jgi:hypothetical protein